MKRKANMTKSERRVIAAVINQALREAGGKP